MITSNENNFISEYYLIQATILIWILLTFINKKNSNLFLTNLFIYLL